MECQVKECTSDAVNYRIERNEIDGRDKEGNYHIIEACIIKTPLCSIHSSMIHVSELQDVSIKDL